MNKLTLVTDAWEPQINGVVTTLMQLVKELEKKGVLVDVIHPNDYRTIPMPTYPEILLVWQSSGLKNRILNFKPDAVHIATEGSLGWKARGICLKAGLPFTTAYHTQYAEYVNKRISIPKSWVWSVLRRFHRPASITFVPAESIKTELEKQGFKNIVLMSRGVDTELFNPGQATDMVYERPIMLYVGRVAIEKNLEKFLSLDLPGSKLIVGRGPSIKHLAKKYPDVVFVGAKTGLDLAHYYASADVFVFPSLTDTFGIVNIEAIASGTPVAAYPVNGPKDIITQGLNGMLEEDLEQAIVAALKLNKDNISNSIPQYSWSNASEQFLNNLELIDKESV